MTGDFSKEGLRDDILDLKPEDLLALKKWVQTYEKDYVSVGKSFVVVVYASCKVALGRP